MPRKRRHPGISYSRRAVFSSGPASASVRENPLPTDGDLRDGLVRPGPAPGRPRPDDRARRVFLSRDARPSGHDGPSEARRRPDHRRRRRGALREVLRYRVKQRHARRDRRAGSSTACRKYFPGLASSFGDRRAAVRSPTETTSSGDGGRFDVILVDSSDPVGPSAILHQRRSSPASRRGSTREA